MAKNLTDLTARTATADSDLIHVNSGGTDYKETKANFSANLAKWVGFANSSALTTQIDALAGDCAYEGLILSYGHQTETGVPINANFYVDVIKIASGAGRVKIYALNSSAKPVSYINFKSGGAWQGWVQDPTRDEITSLNNSFTNGKLHNADHYFANISVGSALYVDLGDIESVFGIPAGSYIVSAFIRGWSGNPGALSLVVSSNGRNLYLMCSATGTVSWVTVRVWYCATN